MVPKGLEDKILFPWDGSLLAEQALGLATFLACRLNMELVIFRALLPPRAELMAAPDLADKNWAEAACKEVEKEAARLCAACGEEVNCSPEVAVVDAVKEPMVNLREMLHDIVAAQVLERAAKPDIGLVVLGSHGASSEMGRPRGGVAVRVINWASKPVLVVPLLPLPRNSSQSGVSRR